MSDRTNRKLKLHKQTLRQLNADALHDKRVRIVNADALQWLEQNRETYDFIVADFPDPSNYSLGKLYSTAFYRLLQRHLAADGLLVVQATSPLLARESYWTVVATLEAAGWATNPYHALVPSFGEWGYILAGRSSYRMPETIAAPTRFLNGATLAALFQFPPDMARVNAEPNRLDRQNLVRVFEREWGRVQAH